MTLSSMSKPVASKRPPFSKGDLRGVRIVKRLRNRSATVPLFEGAVEKLKFNETIGSPRPSAGEGRG